MRVDQRPTRTEQLKAEESAQALRAETPEAGAPQAPVARTPGPARPIEPGDGFVPLPRTPETVVVVEPPPPPPSQDPAAALEVRFGALAEEVQNGPPPPAGTQPAGAGDMTGVEPNQLSQYFAALFADVATMLGLSSADELPPELKASMQDMLLETHGLELPLDPAAQGAIKPSPELVAKVAELMRQGGQLAAPAASGTSKKTGAPQAHENIEIPGPAIVALERGFAQSSFDLSTCDIETAVSMIMFQAGEEADKDLREMIQSMDANRKKRDATRQQMQAMKEQQAATERQLRAEYDRRCRLDPEDEDYIPPDVSFDDYKAQRALEFPNNADGVWDGSMPAGLGADWPTFDKPPSDTGEVDGVGGTEGSGEAGEVTGPEPLTEEEKTLCATYHLSEDQLRGVKQVYDLLGALFPEVTEHAPTLASFLEQPWLPMDTLNSGDLMLGNLGGFGLDPAKSGAENTQMLQKMLDTAKLMLTPERVMNALQSQYTELTMLDIFANHMEDSTDDNATSGKAKLNRQLEALQGKYDELLGAASELFGTGFTLEWHEKKRDVFEQIKTDVTKFIVDSNASVASFVDVMFVAWGQPERVPQNYRYAASRLCEDMKHSSLFTLFNVMRAAGLTEKEAGGLLSTDGADDRMARQYFDSMSDVGASKGPLTEEIDQARYDHQVEPSTGTIAEVLAAIDAAKAAPNQVDRAVDAAAVTRTELAVTDGAQTQTAGQDSAAAPAPAPAPETPATEDPAHEASAAQTGTFADFQLMLDKKKNELDSLSELNETDSLRLQMYMDRRSKLHQTLSNLLKSFSDTKSAIVGNMK